MKNTYLSIGSVTLIIALVLVYVTGCEGDIGSDDCPSLSTEDIIEKEVIEAYHASFFPSAASIDSKDKPAVYVDFSNGITEACLSKSNVNNRSVYEKFFKAISTDEIDYFELSNVNILPYEGPDADIYGYFTYKGHKTSDGKFKVGAPIDKAINELVERDNLSVLISDGELYSNETKDIATNPWASSALAKWFKKGHELFIVYTDFDDTTNKLGKSFRKHMYIMFFIPNGRGELRDKVIDRLKEDNLAFESLSYSTKTKDMYVRQYPDASLPGAEKYIEYFTAMDAYKKSDVQAFEFLDMRSSGFNFTDEGLIYYLRDAGDDNGKKKNYPLMDHLKFDFKNKLGNYTDLKLKLVVHDVYDDFEQWKKNRLARQNPPVIRKSISGADTLEPETNHLIFNCVSTVNDIAPYDIDKKNVKDTVDSFASILIPEFKYNQRAFSMSDKGILDFLELDTDAGWNNEQNEGLYEVLVSFSPKLNDANPNLKQTRENLFRVDIVLEDAALNQNTLNKEALTWLRMDDKGLDEALYISLKNVLEDKNNKPSGVVYSYYIKLGPFNQ